MLKFRLRRTDPSFKAAQQDANSQKLREVFYESGGDRDDSKSDDEE